MSNVERPTLVLTPSQFVISIVCYFFGSTSPHYVVILSRRRRISDGDRNHQRRQSEFRRILSPTTLNLHDRRSLRSAIAPLIISTGVPACRGGVKGFWLLRRLAPQVLENRSKSMRCARVSESPHTSAGGAKEFSPPRSDRGAVGRQKNEAEPQRGDTHRGILRDDTVLFI